MLLIGFKHPLLSTSWRLLKKRTSTHAVKVTSFSTTPSTQSLLFEDKDKRKKLFKHGHCTAEAHQNIRCESSM
jgi:hypothetical protein